MATVPYSREYLDNEANTKSLLPKVGMRDAPAYTPFTPYTVKDFVPKQVAPTVVEPVSDKIAYGKPQISSADKLIPQTIRPEQIGKMGVFAGTVLGELGLINKIKKRQQARTMLPLQAPQVSVAPERDMPSNVLAQRLNQINRVRSSYKGSDAATKLISDQLAAASRVEAMDKLAAERSQLLVDERRRVASETAANQLRAGEIQNQNTERAQQLADYKLESNTSTDEAKKKLLSNVGTQLNDLLETSQAYGSAIKTNQHNANLSQIQSLYDQKAQERLVYLDKGLKIDADRIENEMKTLLNQYNSVLSNNPYGTYWTKPLFKNGGKLIRKK